MVRLAAIAASSLIPEQCERIAQHSALPDDSPCEGA
jgi:hypothetical protein